jgi:hypothetical protein
MKGERLMTTTGTPSRTTAPITAALQPVGRAEMETVEGGLMGELLYLGYLLYRYGYIPPQV